MPIVVLTGFQDEALGDQALKEGAQDYLVKGQVDSKLLARSMRYAIERKAVAEALIGQEVALARAGMLRRSRQRLISTHERLRRDVASQLHDGVRCRLLDLKGQLQQLLKGDSSRVGANSSLEQRDRRAEPGNRAARGRSQPAALPCNSSGRACPRLFSRSAIRLKRPSPL